MKIQNLKTPQDLASAPAPASDGVMTMARAEPAGLAAPRVSDPGMSSDRQALEIALLKARIQHLELVVETARSLLGSNQERLLRRLHEVPRELVMLTTQLHRIDPHAAW